MAFKSYREESKTNWGTNDQPAGLTIEQIQTGCLLRIADASELMARNYLQLQSDLNMYKRWHKEEVDKNSKLQRQVNAYRGIVKKLKK